MSKRKFCLLNTSNCENYPTPSKNLNTSKMKTAVTVLQEMMTKLGQTPEYECISQTGPQHSACFQYRCLALGEEATASARSKKEAKQEVARVMLSVLAARGEAVPHPYGVINTNTNFSSTPGTSKASTSSASTPGPHSYVMLLRDLSEEYRLPEATYELVGDTGPPHLRHFTIKAQVGQNERLATATTKKAARQLAAEQLYKYMRENLARVTSGFVEEEAVVRAHERVMERYMEVRDKIIWRPDLSQRISNYHLALNNHIDADKLRLAKDKLKHAEKVDVAIDPDILLDMTTEALELTVKRSTLNSLYIIELAPTSPALTFAGHNSVEATSNALMYLKLTIC